MSQPPHGNTGETSNLQIRSHHLGERHICRKHLNRVVTHGTAAQNEGHGPPAR